ncbi:MAG TPA: hypothetical protein VNF75_03205 [Candidatus Dormibacteraeota bacterium]|nr:hypothetical protein [Candidatus Dormibacteraeota bacterium]
MARVTLVGLHPALGLTFLDEGTWVQGYTSTVNNLGVAVGEVRHDLGLSPVS